MPSALPLSARRAVLLARAALLWERAAPVWTPLGLTAAGVWAAAAWGVLERAPVPLHAAALAAAAGAGGWAAWRGARRFRWPSRDEARRRAEADGRLRHAPLSVLDDRPETGNAALWAAHRARAEAEAERTRGRRPRAGLAAADPWALRFALPLVLALGLWSAGDAGPERLRFASRPDLKADARPLALEAWATPPEHTGAPPQPLPAGGGAVRLPAGSKVSVAVRGAAGPPVLTGLARGCLAPAGERLHRAEFTVARSGLLTVRRGGVLARWRVAALPDRKPEVAFETPPSRGERDALVLLYRGKDDHRLAAVHLEVRRGLRRVRFPVETPASPDAPQGAAVDLTGTPFAGRMVQATLVAVDAGGQEGKSRTVRVRAPERTYSDPAAMAVAEAAAGLRREWRFYAWRKSPAPEPVTVAEARLMATLGPYYALHDAPPAVKQAAVVAQRLLDGAGPPLRDPVAAAGLTWTLRRLAGAQRLRDAKALTSELTAMADRLEHGPAGSTKEALRQAQRRLREAVAREAPPEEIARLLDEAKAAMAEHLAALQRTPPPSSGGGEAGGTVTDGDMEALWRAVEEALARGDTEQAMALMDAMTRLAAALQPGGGDGNGGTGGGGRPLDQLRDQQQALSDDSFGLSRGEGDGDLEALAERQARLAARTRAAARTAGAAGRELDEAAAAMEDAASALQGYGLDEALRAQRRAQTALAEGARAMDPDAGGRMLDQALGEADPLGRRAQGGGVTQATGSSEADAPAAQTRRALEAIRARAADRGRPEAELRYLDRLLERF